VIRAVEMPQRKEGEGGINGYQNRKKCSSNHCDGETNRKEKGDKTPEEEEEGCMQQQWNDIHDSVHVKSLESVI
jgi:hypothetical protein